MDINKSFEQIKHKENEGQFMILDFHPKRSEVCASVDVVNNAQKALKKLNVGEKIFLIDEVIEHKGFFDDIDNNRSQKQIKKWFEILGDSITFENHTAENAIWDTLKQNSSQDIIQKALKYIEDETLKGFANKMKIALSEENNDEIAKEKFRLIIKALSNIKTSRTSSDINKKNAEIAQKNLYKAAGIEPSRHFTSLYGDTNIASSVSPQEAYKNASIIINSKFNSTKVISLKEDLEEYLQNYRKKDIKLYQWYNNMKNGLVDAYVNTGYFTGDQIGSIKSNGKLGKLEVKDLKNTIYEKARENGKAVDEKYQSDLAGYLRHYRRKDELE